MKEIGPKNAKNVGKGGRIFENEERNVSRTQEGTRKRLKKVEKGLKTHNREVNLKVDKKLSKSSKMVNK